MHYMSTRIRIRIIFAPLSDTCPTYFPSSAHAYSIYLAGTLLSAAHEGGHELPTIL
jgi:hypothetical protein